MRKCTGAKIVIMSLFTITLMFFGCKSTSPPVTFYTLTPMTSEGLGNPGKFPENIRIGIGPARFPKLIERSQIVTRTTPNTIDLDEFNRWGGSLKQDFLNVIAENLNMLTGSRQILVYPWVSAFSPAWRIEFDVHQFDGALGGSVLLNVTWTIKKQGSEDLLIKKSVIEQNVAGSGYEELVQAKSKALETLSQTIVKEIMQTGK